MARLDADGWTRYTLEEIGFSRTDPFWGRGTALAATPDGTIWAGTRAQVQCPGGLARFDGETGEQVESPDGGEDGYGVADLAVGPDGALWTTVLPDGDGSRPYLARWDGQTWTSFDWPSWVEGYPSGMVAGPDGTVWFR